MNTIIGGKRNNLTLCIIFIFAIGCLVGCGGGGGNTSQTPSPTPTPTPTPTPQNDPFAAWHVRLTYDKVFAFSDFAYGNGTYVSVGGNGGISTSADAIRWTIRTSGTSNSLSRVIFAKGIFIAIGANGTILTSADGINWTVRNSGTAYDIKNIAFGNGIFIVLDSNGINSTSSDGVNWQTNLSFRQSLNAITYGNGLFVGVGINFIATSVDGISWSPVSAAVTGNNIVYGNSTFILSGGNNNSPTTVLLSTDGVHWSAKDTGIPLERITFGNGKFLSFVSLFDNSSGNYSHSFATSTDGKTWNVGANIGPDGLWDGVGIYCSFANNIFICEGSAMVTFFAGYTVTYYTLISEDGINWTQRFLGETIINNSVGGSVHSSNIAYANGLFFDYDQSMHITLTSPDGLIWTLESASNNIVPATNISSAPPASLIIPSQVVYANGMFVGILNALSSNSIVTSADGINWTIGTSGIGNWLGKIAYGNGVFVAVGGNGMILTSADGNSWKTRTSGTTNYLRGVTYGNGTFVAVGDLGEIVTSTDGANWTRINAGTVDNLSDITYGNGSFVIAGKNFTLTSPDTITWQKTSQQYNFLTAYFIDGSFIAIVSSDTGSVFPSTRVITSLDGINWQLRRLPVGSFISGITSGNGSAIIVGDAIYQSDPF